MSLKVTRIVVRSWVSDLRAEAFTQRFGGRQRTLGNTIRVTDLLSNLLLERRDFGSLKGKGAFLQAPGPEALGEIGVVISFSLTAGEQMSFTSVFNVVPAPGGLAVFGLAALVFRRRRRPC